MKDFDQRTIWSREYAFGVRIRSVTRIGALPASDPFGPESIIATIHEAMGIDSNGIIHDYGGRPNPIAQHGTPIRDVLA